MVRVIADVSLHMRTPFIAAFSCVAALASCTYPDEAHLYNNVGATVTVYACGNEKRLLPDEIFKLQSASWCREPLRLTSRGSTWTYKAAPLGWSSYDDDAYVGQTAIGNRLVRFQVNRDGNIMVVPVSATLPITADIRQPAGFPAKPDTGAS